MMQLHRYYLHHQAWRSRELMLYLQRMVLVLIAHLVILSLENYDKHDLYIDAVLQHCSMELRCQFQPMLD